MSIWGNDPDDEQVTIVNAGIVNLGGTLVIDGQTVTGDGAVVYLDDYDD